MLFPVLAFLMPIKTKAQISFTKTTFNTRNGLSHNFVKHISQDSTGFLWISTWDGLSRFDGNEFRNYYHKPNDSTSFPFFIVNKTIVDKRNNVWVFCPQNDLVVYNRAKDNFDRFRRKDMTGFGVSDITTDNHQNIWILEYWNNHLYCLNPDNMEFKSVKMICKARKNPSWDTTIPSIVFDNLGNIWLFYFSQNKYCISKGTVQNDTTISFHEFEPLHLTIFDPLNENKTPRIFEVFETKEGKTWLFTTFGVYVLQLGGNKFTKSTALKNDGNLKEKPFFYWSDIQTGISFFDTKSSEENLIKTDTANYVSCIFIDSEKNIWSGENATSVDNIGLKRFTKIPDPFKHYFTQKNESGNIHIIFPILKDKFGDLWTSARKSDYVYRVKSNGEVLKVKYLNKFKGVNPLAVRSMSEDSLGIWMGCTGDYLLYYSFADQQFTRAINLKNKINHSAIELHNVKADDGGVIINGKYSVFRYDNKSDSVQLKYKGRDTEPKFCIVGDGKNGYWLGSRDNQVVHTDADFKELKTYRIGTGGVLVEHICPGDNNDIWVALMGGGLGHLFLENDSVEIFTTADGLSNNTTYSILKDRNGNLWISTNIGISRFNPETKIFRTYGKAEGLMIEEFNSDACFQSADGEMFFGGVGGMISFYPDSVENNRQTQNNNRLLITDFNVSGSPRFFEKPIYELGKISLEKGDNNFQLTFAAIDFRNAENINYRYKLSGSKNNAWIETDHRHRNISYANLAPGNYKLQIEATNIAGEWDSATNLLLIIPHFFYQTWWFKVLVVLFFTFIATTIIVLYNRQILLNERQKQDVLKLESLRGQMNPHFIFNSLNSINYFISNNDKISANRYIADFSRLIRAFLNNLSYDYVPLEKELESLEDYLKLEHLRFKNKFDYVLLAGKIMDKENIEVFPGMVQPFIENAIWHGVRSLENRKGFIRIEFVPVNESKIQCIIEDDGIGRKQAKLFQNKMPGKKSLGIGIVTERLRIVSKIMNTDYRLSISDAKLNVTDTGTLVIIELPVK